MFMLHIGKLFGAKSDREDTSQGQSGPRIAKSFPLVIEPTALPALMESPNTFPVQALSPRARRAALAIQAITQAPEALAAQSVLAAMSLSVSSIAKVQSLIPNAAHPVALFLITVAESGERKTTVDGQAMGGINDLINDMVEQHQEQVKDFLIQVASCQKGDPRPQEPEMKAFLSNEPTTAGILRIISGGINFCGLFTDEAGMFFGGFSMSKENRMSTAGVLSKLWDLATIFRPRAKASSTDVIPACPTTVNFMIQPVILEDSYNDDFLIGQGLLARMLPAWPRSHIGFRPFREADEGDLAEVEDFRKRTRDLVERALEENSALRVLKLEDSAKSAMRSFHDEIEYEMRPGGRFEDIRGFASKATEHALRLAGVMTLYEDETAVTVDDKILAGALEMTRFYLEEFRHIRNAAKCDQIVEKAEHLRRWLLERVKPGKPFTREMIQQNGPASLRRNEVLNKVIPILVEYGWIQTLPNGSKVDGKIRRVAYRISPKL